MTITDGYMVLVLSIFMTLLCFGWIYLGSISSIHEYESTIKEKKEPKPDDYSIAFSLGPAFIIFVLCLCAPVGYLIETYMGISFQLVDAFLKENKFYYIVLLPTLIVLFALIATFCEWLLRKMARRKHPQIKFEPFFGLN